MPQRKKRREEKREENRDVDPVDPGLDPFVPPPSPLPLAVRERRPVKIIEATAHPRKRSRSPSQWSEPAEEDGTSQEAEDSGVAVGEPPAIEADVEQLVRTAEVVRRLGFGSPGTPNGTVPPPLPPPPLPLEPVAPEVPLEVAVEEPPPPTPPPIESSTCSAVKVGTTVVVAQVTVYFSSESITALLPTSTKADETEYVRLVVNRTNITAMGVGRPRKEMPWLLVVQVDGPLSGLPPHFTTSKDCSVCFELKRWGDGTSEDKRKDVLEHLIASYNIPSLRPDDVTAQALTILIHRKQHSKNQMEAELNRLRGVGLSGQTFDQLANIRHGLMTALRKVAVEQDRRNAVRAP
eukprot:Sspe_Gene.65907::Locus_38969_Transcript_1_1_Confidence_1.000_Length_1152::g.65907::m.65907